MNSSIYIYDEVHFWEPFVTITYLDFWYIQNLSIFRIQDIRYRESLKYSLHRTLCNLDIFITHIYWSPSILRIPGIWWAVFYETLCNTGIFRTRGIFRTLLNVYYEEFYSQPFVTLSYLKLWHIQDPRHIHHTVKNLLWNILFKTLYNPDIFRTLIYSQLWYVLKPKHIRSHAKYLKWSISLKPCVTIVNLVAQYIQNFRLFKTRLCQLLLNVWAILQLL